MLVFFKEVRHITAENHNHCVMLYYILKYNIQKYAVVYNKMLVTSKIIKEGICFHVFCFRWCIDNYIHEGGGVGRLLWLCDHLLNNCNLLICNIAHRAEAHGGKGVDSLQSAFTNIFTPWTIWNHWIPWLVV